MNFAEQLRYQSENDGKSLRSKYDKIVENHLNSWVAREVRLIKNEALEKAKRKKFSKSGDSGRVIFDIHELYYDGIYSDLTAAEHATIAELQKRNLTFGNLVNDKGNGKIYFDRPFPTFVPKKIRRVPFTKKNKMIGILKFDDNAILFWKKFIEAMESDGFTVSSIDCIPERVDWNTFRISRDNKRNIINFVNIRDTFPYTDIIEYKTVKGAKEAYRIYKKSDIEDRKHRPLMRVLINYNIKF